MEIWAPRQWLLGAPGFRGTYPAWLPEVQEVEGLGWCIRGHGWWGQGVGKARQRNGGGGIPGGGPSSGKSQAGHPEIGGRSEGRGMGERLPWSSTDSGLPVFPFALWRRSTVSRQRSMCCHELAHMEPPEPPEPRKEGSLAACESGLAVLFSPEVSPAPGHVRNPKPPSLVSDGWGYLHQGTLILSLDSLWTHKPSPLFNISLYLSRATKTPTELVWSPLSHSLLLVLGKGPATCQLPTLEPQECIQALLYPTPPPSHCVPTPMPPELIPRWLFLFPLPDQAASISHPHHCRSLLTAQPTPTLSFLIPPSIQQG